MKRRHARLKAAEHKPSVAYQFLTAFGKTLREDPAARRAAGEMFELLGRTMQSVGAVLKSTSEQAPQKLTSDSPEEGAGGRD